MYKREEEGGAEGNETQEKEEEDKEEDADAENGVPAGGCAPGVAASASADAVPASIRELSLLREEHVVALKKSDVLHHLKVRGQRAHQGKKVAELREELVEVLKHTKYPCARPASLPCSAPM